MKLIEMDLSIIFATVLVSLISLLFLTKRRPRKDEPPILPYWIPFIGSALDFQKNGFEFLKKGHKKLGPIFTCYMGGKYYHFVSDPFTFPSIAKEKKRLCFRKFTLKLTEKIFDVDQRESDIQSGHNAITRHLQGENLEEFQQKMMVELTEVFDNNTLYSEEWKERGLFDLLFSTMFFAEISIMFGKQTGDEDLRNKTLKILKEDFETFDKIVPKIAQGYPYSSCKEFVEARGRLWKFLQDSLFDNKNDFAPFIEDLVSSRIAGGGTELQASKEAYALLWAAAANTNTTVFWSIYYILTHREALDAAQKEIKKQIIETNQLNSKVLNFTRNQLGKMTVLNSIVLEAMRLTVSSSSPRMATENMQLKISSLSETKNIRKDDMVMVSFQLLHFDEDLYPEPYKFKYDRFLNKDGTEKTVFYKNGKQLKQYIEPFGMGISKCPGRFWVMTELKQVIILFLNHIEFKSTNLASDIGTLKDRFMLGTLYPSRDPKIFYRKKPVN